MSKQEHLWEKFYGAVNKAKVVAKTSIHCINVFYPLLFTCLKTSGNLSMKRS